MVGGMTVSCITEKKNCVGWNPVKLSDVSLGDVLRFRNKEGNLVPDFGGATEFKVVLPQQGEPDGVYLAPFCNT